MPGNLVICPACNKKLQVGASVVPGSVVRCPYCSQKFVIKGAAAASPRQPAPRQPSRRQPAPLRPVVRRKGVDPTLVYVGAGVSACLILFLILALAIMLSGKREVASNAGEAADTAAAPAAAAAEQDAPPLPDVSQSTHDSASDDSQRWQEFRCAEGGYRAEFPGNPKRVPAQVSGNTVQFSAEIQSGAYIASHNMIEDVPLPVEKRRAAPRKIIRRSFVFGQVPCPGRDGPMLSVAGAYSGDL